MSSNGTFEAGPALFTVDLDILEDKPAVAMATGTTTLTESDRVLEMEAVLEEQTHVYRLATQRALDSGKGTASAYSRHIKRYIQYWSESAVGLQTPAIPVFPITATKVAKFLEYETTRNKVCSLFIFSDSI